MDVDPLTAPARPGVRHEALVIIDADGRWLDLLPTVAEACRAAVTVAVVRSGADESIDLPEPFDVGPGALLVVSQGRSGCLMIDATGVWVEQREMADDADDATAWVVAELWRRGVAPAAVLVVAGDRAVEALDEQVHARRRRELPTEPTDSGWVVERSGFDLDRIRVDASLFALADGQVGSSGALLAAHPGGRRWVLAANAYVGSGPDTRLLTAPVALQLPFDVNPSPELHRVLDLHSGVLWETISTTEGLLVSARFSSLARPGTVVFRAHCPAPSPERSLLLDPIDDRPAADGRDGDMRWVRVPSDGGGIVAAACDVDDANVVDRVAVYRADDGRPDDPGIVMASVKEASSTGFDGLLAEHRRTWAQRWEDADVVVEGDDELQQAIRFSLFQLMASVGDQGEAAVGARGLTGTSYRGHVFWDADTFTLPFLAATHPASARAMLEYRIRRLPAAIESARALGRAGARFPWESARSGRDVTPTSARDRTGRVVPIRTGQLEEHIVAQVAWAACCYADWSGDEAFLRGAGSPLLVETARYWASRVRTDRLGAHIYGVIGPDEYHEPVDDNAFTNVMARWNLRRAAALVRAGEAGEVTALEVDRWLELADTLVDGYDADTGIYEQFAGFHALEPLLIAEIAPRRPIAADLLLGADRVNAAQVIKQADVLMLHHLVPDEVEHDSLEPNLRYYEPRTAHGSSLSPGIHAALFARARNYEGALDALQIASRMDLDDLTGSTAGGLHLATMGGLWQALAFGFAGLRPRDGRLCIDPRLPPAWAALELRVRFHGNRVVVRIEHDDLVITADAPTAIEVDGTEHVAATRPLELRRRGRRWEVGS
jgi:hypothetical protein